ncbi:MAG: Hpt domain-containing protein [Spirochaetota bacterium]
MGVSNIINVPELIERLDNDFELYLELLELFTTDSASIISRIENAIINRDSEALRKAAHTLKGAVANFSAPAAYEAASILEQTGKNRELTNADDQFLKLKTEIDSVIKEMKKISQKGSF